MSLSLPHPFLPHSSLSRIIIVFWGSLPQNNLYANSLRSSLALSAARCRFPRPVRCFHGVISAKTSSTAANPSRFTFEISTCGKGTNLTANFGVRAVVRMLECYQNSRDVLIVLRLFQFDEQLLFITQTLPRRMLAGRIDFRKLAKFFEQFRRRSDPFVVVELCDGFGREVGKQRHDRPWLFWGRGRLILFLDAHHQANPVNCRGWYPDRRQTVDGFILPAGDDLLGEICADSR